MISIPIINERSTAETRPAYLAWLKKAGADRVFVCPGNPYGDKEKLEAIRKQLAENIAYYSENGLDVGFAYYERTGTDPGEVNHYARLRDLAAFRETPAEDIQGSGYVVETLEAVVWALITEDSLEESLLKVVNLGRDTDTTGAIAGGLAALYYGFDAIPPAWINEIQRKEWIEELCEKAEKAVP